LRPVTYSDPLWPPLPDWEAVGVGVGVLAVLWALEPSEGLELLPGVGVVDGVGAGCEVGCGVGGVGALGVVPVVASLGSGPQSP
jgi:hypothetical protein